MFCMHCGQKLPDDARFCTSCGASVQEAPAQETPLNAERENAPETDKAQQTAANAAAFRDDEPMRDAASSEQPLKHVIEDTKRRSKRPVPMILLVALALALAAGTAYAAYRVYTEIIAPQQQQQQAAPDAQASDEETPYDNQAESEPEPSDAVETAEGHPQSILQVAEILAMNPADIPSYLESQGLAESQDQLAPESTYWIATDNTPYASIDPEEIFLDGSEPEFGAPYASLTIGMGISPIFHGFFAAEPFASEALEDGDAPDSIVIDMIPFRFAQIDAENPTGTDPADASDETLKDFARLCGFETIHADTANLTIPHGNDAGIRVCGGAVEVRGDTMLWYLAMHEGLLGCTLGCMSEKVAFASIENNVALYTRQQWDAASDAEKAEMLSISMLQDRLTGNGGLRRNILTGTIEAWEEDADAKDGYAFHACEIRTDPATGKETYFSTYSGLSQGAVEAWGSL